MAKSIKVVFIKQFSEETSGTIYIRTIESRKAKKKSTGIKLQEKDWEKFFNKNTGRFRSDKRFLEHEKYNDRIEECLEEVGKYKNQLEYIPNQKKSFLTYWNDMVRGYSNHGTVIKHQVVRNKLLKYLNSINKSDLLFSEITPMFIKELRVYFKAVRDPKSLSENTVNHYLKVIQSVINQASSDDYYSYIKHPFNGLKFSKKKVLKDILGKREIERLIKVEIEIENIIQAREMFLFQMFSNGMRVSDVFLLRWKNIQGTRLKYKMFKTGTEMDIPLNINMAIILSGYLGIKDRYEQLLNHLRIGFVNPYRRTSPIQNFEAPFTLPQLDELIDKNIVKGTGRKVVKTARVSIAFKEAEVEDYKGFKIFQGDAKIKSVIDKREELLDEIDRVFIAGLVGRIDKMSKKERNQFIFPILNAKTFTSNDGIYTIEQYKKIKHCSIVYNRNLKKVQKTCEIQTNLTSHVARHSYTNLLLGMEGVNLYDISQSLGHSNIKTTESYLRSGFNIEKVDYLNKKISGNYSLGRK